jgi:flap endonuclease-1
MGLNITEIVPKRELQFNELKGKTLAVDAFNTIYQFLSTIRQLDGTPLQDSKGKITSHLSGLFYRNVNLLSEGIKLIYVFDGKPPELKYLTGIKRQEVKDNAKEMYEKAVAEKDYASMRKYSQQMTKITDEIIKESKELLEAMGIAIIQAPEEGEAQASWIAKNNKDVFAVVSQDYDSLLFGAPRLIQNLTMARKRKTATGFIEIKPELIELEKTLNTLQINQDQLISLGILIGTDYNPRGIKGIGPKKALTIVRQYKQPALIFKALEEQIISLENPFDWTQIFEQFHKPNIDKNPKIEFKKMNIEKVKQILLSRDFSEERIQNSLEKLEKSKEERKQRGIGEFF